MNIDVQNEELSKQLANFLELIKKQSGENLRSVLVYGGLAKEDFSYGKSNVNLLLVFDSVDLTALDRLALVFQQAAAQFRMSPLILTSSELAPASDVFAVKLFDIQKHNIILYGEDPTSALTFEKSHLSFIAEQDLRNQLARMKYFYIQNLNLYDVLLTKVHKGLTSLLINANIFLYLKRSMYLQTRKEITEQLLKEPEMDRQVLESLLKLKDGEIEKSPETIKKAYDDLMIQYKQLIKAFKKVAGHG